MQDTWDAKPVPGSGSILDSKLDGVISSGPLAGYRIENKFTEKASFNLTIAMLKKAESQALITGDKAIMRIDLNGKVGMFIPEKLFKELVYYEEEENS